MLKIPFILDLLDNEHRSLVELVHLVLLDLDLVVTDLGASVTLRNGKLDVTEFAAMIQRHRCRLQNCLFQFLKEKSHKFGFQRKFL